jgi:hypothetical protein
MGEFCALWCLTPSSIYLDPTPNSGYYAQLTRIILLESVHPSISHLAFKLQASGLRYIIRSKRLGMQIVGS